MQASKAMGQWQFPLIDDAFFSVCGHNSDLYFSVVFHRETKIFSIVNIWCLISIQHTDSCCTFYNVRVWLNLCLPWSNEEYNFIDVCIGHLLRRFVGSEPSTYFFGEYDVKDELYCEPQQEIQLEFLSTNNSNRLLWQWEIDYDAVGKFFSKSNRTSRSDARILALLLFHDACVFPQISTLKSLLINWIDFYFQG